MDPRNFFNRYQNYVQQRPSVATERAFLKITGSVAL
jgi:hypothetical protein